jgi:hypothetical protein
MSESKSHGCYCHPDVEDDLQLQLIALQALDCEISTEENDIESTGDDSVILLNGALFRVRVADGRNIRDLCVLFIRTWNDPATFQSHGLPRAKGYYVSGAIHFVFEFLEEGDFSQSLLPPA